MTNIPIKSHHCTTTHSACECVLERLKKLEKIVEAAKEVVATISIESDEEDVEFFCTYHLDDVVSLIQKVKDLERE